MKIKQLRSEQLKAELNQTDAKINELRPVFDKLAADLVTANTRFLNSEIKIEDLLSAKNHHSLISESIDALAQNRKRIEGEIEAALAIEAHQDTVNGMLALATLRRTSEDRLKAAREAFNKATNDLLGASIRKFLRYPSTPRVRVSERSGASP